jgi:hypothetical protein
VSEFGQDRSRAGALGKRGAAFSERAIAMTAVAERKEIVLLNRESNAGKSLRGKRWAA